MMPRELVQIRQIEAGDNRRYRLALWEFDRWRYLNLERWVRDSRGNWVCQTRMPIPFQIIDELVAAIDIGLEISTGNPTDTRARQLLDGMDELHRRRGPKEPAA
jgi:hypothetical protein